MMSIKAAKIWQSEDFNRTDSTDIVLSVYDTPKCSGK